MTTQLKDEAKFQAKLSIEYDNAIPQAGRLNGNTADFILAGNATFTILNSETGNRFTFKVAQPTNNHPHFVRVMTGPDNENNFSFLGTIFDKKNYRHGERSTVNQAAQSAKVFSWAWPQILAHSLPEQIEIHHQGSCGRCGRKLTVPESILSGFGPECIKHI